MAWLRRQALKGGITSATGVGYLATLAALRTMFANNVGSGNPHSLPEDEGLATITTLAGNPPPSGITQGLDWYPNGSASALAAVQTALGGVPLNYATFFQSQANCTVFSSGGRFGGGVDGSRWRYAFDVNTDKVAFALSGNSVARVRLLVNGQYVSKTPFTPASSSGRQYGILTFPGVATRTVMVEGEQDQGFLGIYVPTGRTVSLASVNRDILLILGDSITQGTGPTLQADGVAAVAADYLGIANGWASGAPGEGFVNSNSNTVYTLGQRVVADVQRAKDHATAMGANIPLVLVLMGLNDLGMSGVSAAASSVLDTIHAMLPNAIIVASTGPYDTQAPSAPAPGYAVVKAAVEAACVNRPYLRTIDLEGVAFTKKGGGDLIHPDTAGAMTLGQSIATKVRAAIAT